MKLNIKIYSLVFAILFFSCSKDKGSTNQESKVVFSSEYTAQIVEEGAIIINNEIDLAVAEDTFVDTEKIRSEIESIKGVKTAQLSTTGGVILVEEDNGAVLNLLIFSKADPRFIMSESISEKAALLTSKLPPVVARPDSDPGRAIILAPFDWEFKENLTLLKNRFEAANYATDIFTNEEASLDKFRSSFLKDYNIIYISSHGDGATLLLDAANKVPSVNIMTGELAIEANWDKLPLAEQRSTIKGRSANVENSPLVFGVTPDWFDVTSDGDLTNAWIYFNSCHGATTGPDNKNFYDVFFNLNAAAFNSHTDYIFSKLGGPISVKAAITFSSGKSFLEMDELVKNDVNLKSISYALRLKKGNDPKFASIDLFTSIKNISDPFYLVLPNDLVGNATLTPNSGPEDTEVTFQVVIQPDYIDKVDHITFDIDTTNQTGLEMTKVNDNTWEYTDLTAPDGEFPRIDTFAYTAFDNENNVLGEGSAAFSFSGGSSGKSTSNTNIFWSK